MPWSSRKRFNAPFGLRVHPLPRKFSEAPSCKHGHPSRISTPQRGTIGGGLWCRKRHPPGGVGPEQELGSPQALWGMLHGGYSPARTLQKMVGEERSLLLGALSQGGGMS